MSQATKKKTTKTTKTAPSRKPAIPTAGGGKPSSRADLLAAFAKKAKPEQDTKKKTARPTLELPEEVVAQLAEYAPTKVLFDIVSERKERQNAELKQELFGHFLRTYWEKQARPNNPKVQARNDQGKVDSEGILQLKAIFRINMPTVGEDEDPSEVMVNALTEVGLEECDARKLVDKELDFTPKWGVDLTEVMTKGDGPAKSAAEKFFLLSQGVTEDENGDIELTAQEWGALGEIINSGVKHGVELVDKANFLERACTYCHSLDQLDALFSVIVPQAALSGIKFAVNDSTDDRNKRLIEEAARILGAELGVN
jgi:hypothetical protein